MSHRAAWDAFKATAARRPGSPAEKVASEALAAWAGAPTDAARADRELLCASLVGAMATDFAIAKLAEERAVTAEEREFLLDLNAEAALGDLARLTKRAAFGDHVVGALAAMAQHPKTTGALVGGAVGAGLGAWKDDENRLRGAALYAVPGAVIGGIGGAIGGELLERHLAHGVAQDAMARTHAIAGEAQPLIEALQSDSVALARKRTEGAAARRIRAQEAGSREALSRDLEHFDRRLVERATERAADAQAQQRSAIQARIHAHQRTLDADRFHEHLLASAHSFNQGHHDQETRNMAQAIIDDLTRNREEYTSHMIAHGQLHPEFVEGHIDLPRRFLDTVVDRANRLFKLGPSAGAPAIGRAPVPHP